MPNDMYKEYQSLSGNKDPMAMQKRRELARGLQAQRRGQVPPGTVAAPSLQQSRDRQAIYQGLLKQSPDSQAIYEGLPGMPANMPQRPANMPGDRMGQMPVNPGNRMPVYPQGNIPEFGAFNTPDMQTRINQILSQFNRRA
jgi:hypothetical protein